MYRDTAADKGTMFIQGENLNVGVVALTMVPVLSGWRQGASEAQGHPWLCETLSLKATQQIHKKPFKTLMFFPHRAVLLSAWTREASFCSRLTDMRRLTMGKRVENKWVETARS